jgi:hypothetical protein
MENKMSDGGKGSSPRPLSVSNEEYANRWNAIFGRDLDKVIIDEIGIKAKQEHALNEMVRISQEMGLYDEFEDKPTRNNEETQTVKIKYVK